MDDCHNLFMGMQESLLNKSELWMVELKWIVGRIFCPLLVRSCLKTLKISMCQATSSQSRCLAVHKLMTTFVQGTWQWKKSSLLLSPFHDTADVLWETKHKKLSCFTFMLVDICRMPHRIAQHQYWERKSVPIQDWDILPPLDQSIQGAPISLPIYRIDGKYPAFAVLCVQAVSLESFEKRTVNTSTGPDGHMHTTWFNPEWNR